MKKEFFKIFCVLNIIAVVNCLTENSNDGNSYELNGIITRIWKNVLQDNQHGELHETEFTGINEEINFEASGILLKNSSRCMDDLNYILENIKSPWAMEMFDSFGKPESGILQGNLKWVGDYNECVNVRSINPNSSTIGNFRGKYCLAEIVPNKNTSQFAFTFALCVPDSCSAEEIREEAWQLLRMAGSLIHIWDRNYTSPNAAVTCKPTERHLHSSAIAMIFLLSIFCALTVLGSSITAVKYFKNEIKESKSPSNAGDVYENNQIHDNASSTFDGNHKHGVPDDEALRQDDDSAIITSPFLQKLEPFLNCFCMFTNGKKLLNTASSEGELLCIHGIRFLSISWVILGHTFALGFAQMRNLRDLFSIVDTFAFQVILQAIFSVDSFFALSGFLLTFLFMKEFSKTKGKTSWAYFYIHRYLRLTPVYMILLGFSGTVFLYLGSGPFWPDGDYDINCKKTWWSNLLYINNFGEDTGKCMSWSWYLANDMQFFVISPLFLITLSRWPKVGYCVLAIFLAANCFSNFFITYHYDLIPGLVGLLNKQVTSVGDAQKRFADYTNLLYIKPYNRIGAYLVGIFTGYILFKRKSSKAPRHSLVVLVLGWAIASSVTLATVYGLYHTHPNLVARSFYNSVNRVCFAAGLCWVIYVCLVGQGGFINSILSFKLFIPLSRLTYSAYLIHPMILLGYFQSLKTTVEFTNPTMVAVFLSCILVTFALSLPVALILESPIVSLEKLVRKKFTSKQKNEAVN